MAGKWRFLHRSEEYIFYYRRAIPELLRIYFNNRWEIKKSLRTRDKQVAVIRHNDLNVQVEELFFQIRRGLVMPDANSELSSILNFKKDTIATYSEGEMGAIMSGVIMELRGAPLQLPSGRMVKPAPITIKGDKMYRIDGTQVPEFFVSHAISHANTMGLPPMIDERPFNLFPGKMEWVDNESADAEEEVIVKSKPKAKSEQQMDGSELHAIPFSQMVDRYIKYARFKREQSANAQRAEFNYFIELVGDVQSTEITRPMVMEYREILEGFPKNARKRFPDTPFKELAKRDFPDAERMSAQNVNKYMARLSTMFNWAVDYSYMAADITPNKKLKASDDKKRNPFTTEELQQYFLESPIHRDRITKGNKMEMFWIPLVSLFSGARIEEICGLQMSDVKVVEDNRTGEKVWCFDLNKGYAENEARLKTDPSVRYVPIHSELKRIGFMQYFHQREVEGAQTLWNLKPMNGRTTDKYSQAFGRRHATYLRNTAGITNKKTAFHSFRHNAIQALRENPDVREDYMNALIGHGQKGTSGKDYFAKLGVALVRDTVEGITYPRLDLSHLHVK